MRPVEVEVLDTQLTALRDAQAAAVDQSRHQPGGSLESAKQGPRLGDAEHHRQAVAAPGLDDIGEPLDVEVEHIPAEKR